MPHCWPWTPLAWPIAVSSNTPWPYLFRKKRCNPIRWVVERFPCPHQPLHRRRTRSGGAAWTSGQWRISRTSRSWGPFLEKGTGRPSTRGAGIPWPITATCVSWRVWNSTTANALHPWRRNEAFANGSTYARVPPTWEWLHVPLIWTRWTEYRQTWSCPCDRSCVVSRLGSRPLTKIVRGTTTMTVWVVTIGGIMNTADLPCPMGMTTNKSSLFSRTNVMAKPCSLHVDYPLPSRWRARRERTLCVWSPGGGGKAGWGVVCVTEHTRDARRDAHWDCNGQWSSSWSMPIGILTVELPVGGFQTLHPKP